MRDFRTEEQREIPKSYYRLSEDQLDRLRDLLKKVSIENSSPQSLPRSLRKRREPLSLGVDIDWVTLYPCFSDSCILIGSNFIFRIDGCGKASHIH